MHHHILAINMRLLSSGNQSELDVIVVQILKILTASTDINYTIGATTHSKQPIKYLSNEDQK
jgi:hypothetical protein